MTAYSVNYRFGVIQRSAGYSGNRYYEITDLAEDRQEWDQTAALLESVGSIEAACWPLLADGSLLIPDDRGDPGQSQSPSRMGTVE